MKTLLANIFVWICVSFHLCGNFCGGNFIKLKTKKYRSNGIEDKDFFFGEMCESLFCGQSVIAPLIKDDDCIITQLVNLFELVTQFLSQNYSLIFFAET